MNYELIEGVTPEKIERAQMMALYFFSVGLGTSMSGVLAGYYDMATPFHGIEINMWHLAYDRFYTDRVEFAYYEGGHMMYRDPEARHVFAREPAAVLLMEGRNLRCDVALVKGVTGRLRLRVRFKPTFDFARRDSSFSISSRGVVAASGSESLTLCSDRSFKIRDGLAAAEKGKAARRRLETAVRHEHDLVAALRDPESRAASRRYLRTRS